ncbi:MAG: polymerase sigma factor RpoE [Solirubrobacterales bacterium]|nr:polymerase sigma factor RpoE [Solirubrobacterales bacterium]
MSRTIWSPVSANMPERELIGRAQAGDLGAFEALAEVHAHRLYTVALRFLGDCGEAEDVLQETLLRAWRGIRRFEGRAMVFTWLYRIAVNESNRALDRRQRRRTDVPVYEQAIEVPAPPRDGPASQAERQELREELRVAISQLSMPCRTALVLRDIEGLSTREAAEITGVGEAAFKSRLHQARLRVRALVGDAALVASAG